MSPGLLLALTPRWIDLDYHAEQQRLWAETTRIDNPVRFAVVPAGRRSGKTELAKRFLVLQAIGFHAFPDGNFLACAPTHAQAKDIFWEDLKALIPRGLTKSISETELTITLKHNGARIKVVGLDKPERAEGRPVDGAVIDEYGNMKKDVWPLHLRPALSTKGRLGWAWLIGVPEGRNHYYKMWKLALTEQAQKRGWGAYHWLSKDILDPEEIEAAKDDLDPIVYRQEYEGSFETFEGRCYYNFAADVHSQERIAHWYRPDQPLIFCFDFNRAPGIAIVCQELEYQGMNDNVAHTVTCAIGEVYIPRNSTTPSVCRKLIADWGDHEGPVHFYADATGGAKGSAKVKGSDIDLIEAELGSHFGNRLTNYVPSRNPPERTRVNAVNTRLLSGKGIVRLLVDPVACPYLANDLDSVVTLEGGSGEIDKKHDKDLTHSSDGLGYYIVEAFPITVGKSKTGRVRRT